MRPMIDDSQPNGGVVETGEAATSRGAQTFIQRFIQRREVGVLFAFVVLFSLIAVTRPDVFFNYDAMSGITSRLFRQVSGFLIIGIGMTYLIIGGEFDLSVGSMFAVGGVSFALFLNDFNLTVVAAVVAVLLIGVLVGLTNGLAVTKIGVPSLIMTIGMLSVLRGIAFALTPGGSRQTPDLALLDVFGGSIIIAEVEIAHKVFWSLGLLLVFGFLLQRTKFGYHVFATGDDQAAAEMTGIDTDRVKILNFVLTAVLAAFAGVLSISFFGSMFGTAGAGFELLVIAAVVIGGTNLFGGEGSLIGTLLGSLVIGVIPVLLVLNGLPVDIQELLTGVVIIVAVVLDIILRQRT